ncbi:MAG: CHAT domain-containing tetratricopeptide repeat protein [Planctomycetaceae bacterium]
MRSCELVRRWTGMLAILTLCWPSTLPAADGFMVRVNVDQASIKAGNETLASVPQGSRLWVFNVKDRQWLDVKVPESEQHGYVHISQVEPVVNSQSRQAQVKRAGQLFAEAERFRAQHDLKSSIATLRQCRMVLEQVYGTEHPEVAIVIENIGNRLHELGNSEEAERLHQEALAMRVAILGQQHEDTFKSMMNLAVILPAIGRWQEGLEFEQRTLKSMRQVLGEKDSLTLRVMDNLAVGLVDAGDLEGAEPMFTEVLALRREVLGENHADTLTTLDHLAVLKRRKGDYLSARQLHEQALELRSQSLGEKDPATLDSMVNLALVLSDLGDKAAALTMIEEELTVRREVQGDEHPSTLTSLGLLAVLLSDLGKLDAAKSLFEETLALDRKVLGPQATATLETMNNLANLLLTQGDYAEAQSLHEQVLAINREVHGERHPSTAESLINLGNALNLQGDFVAAKAKHQQAHAIRQEVLGKSHPQNLSTLSNLAMVDLRLGDIPSAVETMDLLRHATHDYTVQVLPALSASEQLQFLQNVDGPRLSRSLNMGRHHRDDPLIAMKSAEWLLNAKGVAQRALSQRTRQARTSDDPQLREDLQRLNSLRSQLARLSVTEVSAIQDALHKQQIQELTTQEAKLARELGQRGVRIDEDTEWESIEGLRHRLPDDSVLIDIVRLPIHDPEKAEWQPAHYVAWIIASTDHGDVQIVDLGDASTIDEMVQAGRKALNEGQEMLSRLGADAAEERVNTPLRILAEHVLDPLLSVVGDAKKLILSPDASLWLVPWSALPMQDERYALEEYELSYVVSGRDLLKKTEPTVTSESPVIFADPNYDLTPTPENSPAATVNRSATRFVGSFNDLSNVGRLPGTAKEARAISPFVQEYLDATPVVHLEDEAREETFKQLDSPPLLVLSTHGFFLEDQRTEPVNALLANEDRKVALARHGQLVENPLLRCGLLLAGCNNRGQSNPTFDDGVLTGMEIVGTNLDGTGLVVLSACETGLGEVQNGEGVAGLRQAFQLAGAESVLATLWQVPDEQTAILMEYFFENLATGQSKAEALRNAQLSLMSLLGRHNNTTHPYFWAAFTLTGSQQ